MKRAIFISYRRDDAEGEAGRLYDDLVRTFGDDSVFMDVAGIEPGSDFRKVIDDNVTGCGVLLAIIGPHWSSITATDGTRRLNDANDFVRLEISTALTKNIAIIPVLVHDAIMPHPEDLPEAIRELSYRNSVELTHVRWNSDVQFLVKALRQYVTTTPATETEPVHATVPVQLPPPVASDSRPSNSGTTSKLPMILGGAIVVLVALIAVLFYVLIHRNPRRDPHQNMPPTVAAQPADEPQQANVLTGNWRTMATVSVNDSLYELQIDGSGPSYNVTPIGKCGSEECRWALKTITLSNGQASGQWVPRFVPQETQNGRIVTITLRPDGQFLSVEVRNEYRNDPAMPERVLRYRFAKQ